MTDTVTVHTYLRIVDNQVIENAVFKTILENAYDEVGFQEAIKDSLPDQGHIESLKGGIAKNKKRLKQVKNDLGKLVDLALQGTLQEETIKEREKSLYEAKSSLTKEIERDEERLRSIPNPEDVQRQASRMRTALMDYFGSEDRLMEMSYDDKRKFLHGVFDGTDEDGNPHGIYIWKNNARGEWDYYINGSLFAGTRTLKYDDIDYKDGTYNGRYLGLNTLAPL